MEKPKPKPQLVMGYWTYLLVRVFIPKLAHLWKRYAKITAYTLGAVFGVFVLVEAVAIGMYQYTWSRQERWDTDVLQPCISERLAQSRSEDFNTEEEEKSEELPTQGEVTEAQKALAELMEHVSERVAQGHKFQQEAERHRAAVLDCLTSLPPRPSQNAFVSAVDNYINDWIGSWF